MKKVAYIELDTHAEIAQNFMELMHDSKEFDVDYYFSEGIIKQIGQHHSNIHLSESTELLNHLNEQKYDLIIIGTAHRYFNLFKVIAEKYNTSIIVHNLKFTEISRFMLFKNIFKKDFKYRLKLWLKEELLSAQDVFKKAKNLLVLDEGLVHDKVTYLPIFFNQYHEQNKSGILTIVIPGAVSQQRRDYKKVLQELTNHQQRNSDRLVQVIFLGKAQGKELRWLQRFELEKSTNISIKFFKEKVSQNIFDDWMNKADVLWCPIQRETEFFSNKEIYGETKMSGNIGDAIKYGIIAFFPESYQSNFEFIINANQNFGQEIFGINLEKSYDFQKEFNRNRISNQLEKTLTSLL
ncbi:hypothetical protein [Kaistella antarctica]|uniref:Glycosyltransferase family 1 protein n=1 Tax=Kaistella antarctica TaxID=266748 RepID=A0A448NMQ1_9FLAO|nr:hypothetical protein [Kaistella antarctica]KEY20048.1 hypothetical protein HY04_02150 [Kaistella antarctica]SEV94366.1 hypothetical protein SAMN05421765_1339 [Kaistella antarctica]VEH95565.1 Uncharacterised protein [Kaistella antarctica]